MLRSLRANIGHSKNHRSKRRSTLACLQLALVFGVVLVALPVGLLTEQSRASRADSEYRTGSTPAEPAAAPASQFVADSRFNLKQLHEKLAVLAAEALAGTDISKPTVDVIAAQSLQVEIAKVGVQRASLAREVAEIFLKEYQEETFPQKKKACEAELDVAQQAVENADRAIPAARQRYARFNRVKTASAADLAREWQVQSGEIAAELERKKGQLAIEQAQAKQHILVYEETRDVQNLKSNVANARSEELARQAALDLEQAKLVKLEQSNDPAMARRPLSDDRKQILELLAGAIPLEEKLSSRLEEIKIDGQPAESVRSEIILLTRELQEVVARAHDASTSAALARLKSALSRARGR